MQSIGLSELDGLYRRVAPTIFRRCLRLLGDPEAARDATQEVFVRVLEHAGKLHDDRGYLPWIYRVATNYCIDQLKRKIGRDNSIFKIAPEHTNVDPEITTHQKEVLELLAKDMDARSQQIAVFAFVDGMTQGEIAEVLGLSRRTVGKTLSKIKKSASQLRVAF